MKKTLSLILLVLIAALVIGAGCRRRPQIIAKGIIFRVEYSLEGGRTGGFTRLNMAGAVPGGNGSYNVDAYGVLTHDFLIITYPDMKDVKLFIPTHRLLDIQFGNGGIKKVDESQTVPASP